jgi:hypothetical protein
MAGSVGRVKRFESLKGKSVSVVGRKKTAGGAPGGLSIRFACGFVDYALASSPPVQVKIQK